MLPEQKSAPGRLLSLDAYRGFVMLAMASGGAVMIGGLARSNDTVSSHLLQILKQQLDHVPWRGCSFWDLIQPSFMFMVGVAMPFSYASRRARGDRWIQMFGHAVLRSLILIVLAIFLASNGSRSTQFSFVNVLGQIGLGYPFVFLLLGRRPALQLAAAIGILLGAWLLFDSYPLPGEDFPAAKYGANDPQLVITGSFAHWNKNANISAAFDRWFLNQFPHPTDHPFVFNEGGYATLNMNSIAIYLMAQLMKPFVGASLRTHFGHELFSGPYGPLIRGSCTLLVFWLICLWLYRQKIVIKI
jgi:heparan-alpha-glucosaminide N-acetyltransferase